MDSRLKTSGMTEGGLKAWGMTEGLLYLFVMPAGPLCHARQAPLSCPPGPFVMPARPLCHARRPPLSCPPGLFVMPAGPLCHSRWPPSVIPAGCQRESSILLCCSFCLYGPCMGEAMDSRLKMSGMTEGGLNTGGMTEGMLCLFVMPAGPLCHVCWSSLSCRRGPSVIPAGFPDNKCRGQG